MFKSLISLKPSLSPKHNRRKSTKNINILSLAIDALFSILDFIELEDLSKLYLIYHAYKRGHQVAAKLILYLTLTLRKYSLRQEKRFLRSVTHSYTIKLKDYTSENNTWKQPITLDIQRTHLNPLSNTGFSEIEFIKKPSSVRSARSKHFETPPSAETKIQLIQPTTRQASRQSPLSVKFNFLIFSCDDSLTSDGRRDSDRKSKDPDSNMKGYLKTVLNAISNRNRQLGYVQGLNYWVKHMYESRFTEEQAFTYCCFLLERLGAEQLFRNQMIRIRELCYVFDVYLYNNLPTLYYLFKLWEVSSTVYAGTWFITLFSEQLPKRMIKKIWRLLIVKGWKVLLQFGVAVLCVFQEAIRKTPQDELFSFMRNLLEKITPQHQQKIWPIMSSIQVSNRMLDYLSKQMTALSEDSQIQLWRIQEQDGHDNSKSNSRLRRSSLSGCRGSLSSEGLTTNGKLKPLITKYIEEQRQVEGCCSPYYFVKQSVKTETDTSEDYSILSACRTVHYQ